jgi:hypothetical protein
MSPDRQRNARLQAKINFPISVNADFFLLLANTLNGILQESKPGFHRYERPLHQPLDHKHSLIKVIISTFPADNGLNPVYDTTIEFDVICPPMAYIRFAVYDEDMFGDPNFVAQAVFPFESLRMGRLRCTIS